LPVPPLMVKLRVTVSGPLVTVGQALPCALARSWSLRASVKVVLVWASWQPEDGPGCKVSAVVSVIDPVAEVNPVPRPG
jgi:hypothetical protein